MTVSDPPKVCVVIFEPDIARRLVVFETCRASAPNVTMVYATSFQEAERLLKTDASALLVVAQSAIPAARNSGNKHPLRWILYEEIFQPAIVTGQLRDRLGIVKQQHQHDGIETILARMIGECDAIKRVRDNIRRFALNDVTVFLGGETGTGKDLCAELLHNCGPRRPKPFRTICCPGITESIWSSELDGYTKGAFSGAVKDRAGRIESAQGGTVFLDEIAEIPVSTQAKLLDFLQHRRITRVGSNDARQVDVRVIAATNKDVRRGIRTGAFREDLYYRLAQTVIQLPPLRSRGKDIVLLAGYFLNKNSREFERDFSLTNKTEQWMLAQRWPGNIRELKDAIHRACLNCHDDETTILPKHLAYA